ncbi:DUF2169 domain-containing protein [Myxococcus sp. CA033]|uniref:DUF2169 family type VI secretion system accessory protein n=1 Tax=Myxococcus sp. CA033 TaxID=2741516 RepID=UPI00157B8DD2|nr:DUF2169 domain-containing protein [Myxococcus sp. CA033]NTX39573.1 DUF2169 domain-containing protein [Myxococcus sp. CA033]
MLQLENTTPFASSLYLFPDEKGVDTLYVVLKATFAMTSSGLHVAETQQAVAHVDEHWGPPGETSLKYSGESHLMKRGTDVVLVGDAHAPKGRPASDFGLSMSVGTLKKLVQVHGDRTWKAGLLGASATTPIPTTRVPLTWERAYGGRHQTGPHGFLAEMRNPVGVGFRGQRAVKEMNGTPLPNLTHPGFPLTSLSDKTTPHGVGFVAPSWQPRMGFAGTYDEAWKKHRAPYLPRDFDTRFFQAAPEGQIYPTWLKGGEPVELINAAPEGVQRFHLPEVDLEASVRIAGKEEKPRLHIETLLLEPDQHRFSLTWRGCVPCDKRALKVEQVTLAVKRMTGARS